MYNEPPNSLAGIPFSIGDDKEIKWVNIKLILGASIMSVDVEIHLSGVSSTLDSNHIRVIGIFCCLSIDREEMTKVFPWRNSFCPKWAGQIILKGFILYVKSGGHVCITEVMEISPFSTLTRKKIHSTGPLSFVRWGESSIGFRGGWGGGFSVRTSSWKC